MTKRIFKSICLVGGIVFVASVILVSSVFYQYFSVSQTKQLDIQVELAAIGVENNGLEYFADLDNPDFRVTWIDKDGTVLYDNRGDQSTMVNHLQREEIKQAIETGKGYSKRYSDTMMKQLVYCAKLLNDGTIIRISLERSSIFTLILDMMEYIVLIVVGVVILSMLLAYRISKIIVKPLNSIDLEAPQKNSEYVELSPLLNRIHTQQTQLVKQAMELENRKNEFEAVTNSMNEGLILLNRKGTILSINDAASKILSAKHDCIGKNILTIGDDLEFQDVLSKALSGGHAEKVIHIRESHYQLDASPVVSDKGISGAALLIFDVTERENAEKMRREFTANVSHELKTPLHTISGYAELIKNEMARPEDAAPFCGKIYNEAQRMIHLVEDIINLSHLDEGAEGMAKTETRLDKIVEEAVTSLESEAKQKDITIDLKLENSVIVGIPQLLSGIVYNLVDNAIKYNHRNGKVYVEMTESSDEVMVSVKDTGIGIPKEDQGRIFERFYRVDKSHSKEVGGTGLGLSIVKHAAKVHDARIEVDSEAGRGTEFRIFFKRMVNESNV